MVSGNSENDKPFPSSVHRCEQTATCHFFSPKIIRSGAKSDKINVSFGADKNPKLYVMYFVFLSVFQDENLVSDRLY